MPAAGARYARCAKSFLELAVLPEEVAFRRSYSLYDPAELTAPLSPELVPDVADLIGEHFEIYSDNLLADHVNRMCLADARLTPGSSCQVSPWPPLIERRWRHLWRSGPPLSTPAYPGPHFRLPATARYPVEQGGRA